MRARLALYSAKIAHEHREVDLKNKPAEMLKISPKGTVPVLHLVDGTILEQSLDIMTWALKNPQLSSDARQLISENDTAFKQALDRYKYPNRYPQADPAENRSVCEEILRKLEDQLTPFLMSTTATMTDMAIFPFVRQFSMVDPEWFETQPYPRLKTWLAHFTSSPLFQQVMQGHEPWSPGDQPTYVTY
jgi:glutathione S-transferase